MAKAGPASDESQDLGATFKLARRRPLNFALLVSKDKEKGLILETHQKRPAKTLRRNAKKNGGGPKGAAGTMTVNGKIVEMQCEDENVPGNLAKIAKKHFTSQGFNFKFVFILPNGETIGDDEGDETEEGGEAVAGAPSEEAAEDAPAGATRSDDAAARDRMMKAFKAMNQPLRVALGEADDAVKKRLGTLAKTFGKEIKGDDMRRAAGVLQLLKKSLDEAGAAAGRAAQAVESATAAATAPEIDPTTQERQAGRMTLLDELERNVDDLLAQFEGQEA